MAQLINIAFLVLLTSSPTLAVRTRYLAQASLEIESVEKGKRDAIEGTENVDHNKTKIDTRAGGLEDASQEQGVAAKNLMQDVGGADVVLKEGDAHISTYAAEDDVEAFGSALKAACFAIYAEAKAAATAEFYSYMDPESDDARESKKEADTAATMLISAETALWEKTDLLASVAFGGEAIVKYLFEDYVPNTWKTVIALLRSLYMQDEPRHAKLDFNAEGIVGLEELQSRLSALERQLKKHSALAQNTTYLEMVKLMIEYVKVVQLELLRKIAVRHGSKDVEGIKVPESKQRRLVLDSFLEAVEKIKHFFELEAIIKKAIADFMKAKVSTPADFALAAEKFKHGLKVASEQLETFDPEIKHTQEAKISKALQEKKRLHRIE